MGISKTLAILTANSSDGLYSPFSTKLMVSLREPVQRAHSAYLDGVKNGQIDVDFVGVRKRDLQVVAVGRTEHYQPIVPISTGDRDLTIVAEVLVVDSQESAAIDYHADETFIGAFAWSMLEAVVERDA